MSINNTLQQSLNDKDCEQPYCPDCGRLVSGYCLGEDNYYECTVCGHDEVDPVWKVTEKSLPDCDSIVEVATKLGVLFDKSASGATGVCPICVADNYDFDLAKKVLQKDYCKELFSAKGYDLHLARDGSGKNDSQFYCDNCHTGGDLLAYVSMYFSFTNSPRDMVATNEFATKWLIENYSALSLCKIILYNVDCYQDDGFKNLDCFVSLISRNPEVFKKIIGQSVEDSFEEIFFDIIDHIL